MMGSSDAVHRRSARPPRAERARRGDRGLLVSARAGDGARGVRRRPPHRAEIRWPEDQPAPGGAEPASWITGANDRRRRGGSLLHHRGRARRTWSSICRIAAWRSAAGRSQRVGALGPMRSVYCRDPDGNLIEIATYLAALMEHAASARARRPARVLAVPRLGPARQLDDRPCRHGVLAGRPCLVPVAPGLLAPSGVLTVGAALVLRDVVQRCLGHVWGLAAILPARRFRCLVAPGSLVLASGVGVPVERTGRFRGLYAVAATRLVLAVVASSAASDWSSTRSCSCRWPSAVCSSCPARWSARYGRCWSAIPFVRLLRRVAPTPA